MRETLRHGDAMDQLWLSHDAICDLTQCHKMSRDVIVCVCVQPYLLHIDAVP